MYLKESIQMHINEILLWMPVSSSCCSLFMRQNIKKLFSLNDDKSWHFFINLHHWHWACKKIHKKFKVSSYSEGTSEWSNDFPLEIIATDKYCHWCYFSSSKCSLCIVELTQTVKNWLNKYSNSRIKRENAHASRWTIRFISGCQNKTFE